VEATKTTTNTIRVGVDTGGIPAESKTYAHWVGWKAVTREDGKLDKVPHDPKTGRRASTTDSRTWATFPEALEALEDGACDGIGFVLSSADPFVGIDLDDCRDPETGEVEEWALKVVERFPNAHAEVSPSGKGVHLLARGKLRGGTKKGRVELYGQERFLTVTGVTL
jgi:putative DNA primase/helicase